MTMIPFIRSIFTAMLFVTVGSFTAQAAPQTVGKDGGPTGAFTYSQDARTAASQHQAKAVVER